jgi:hypothetical protein
MEQASLGVPTVRARQAIRVEMPFEPSRADAVIQEFADRNVDHLARIPHPAQ